jgi:hypothetical protein
MSFQLYSSATSERPLKKVVLASERLRKLAKAILEQTKELAFPVEIGEDERELQDLALAFQGLGCAVERDSSRPAVLLIRPPHLD